MGEVSLTDGPLFGREEYLSGLLNFFYDGRTGSVADLDCHLFVQRCAENGSAQCPLDMNDPLVRAVHCIAQADADRAFQLIVIANEDQIANLNNHAVQIRKDWRRRANGLFGRH